MGCCGKRDRLDILPFTSSNCPKTSPYPVETRLALIASMSAHRQCNSKALFLAIFSKLPLATSSIPACLQAQLADVKWQQAVFEVLLSYHPFWLRLGLETVVGQLLSAETGKQLHG